MIDLLPGTYRQVIKLRLYQGFSNKESGNDLSSMMGPSTSSDLQGEFKVSGLLPGRHRLYARAGGSEDAQMASAPVDVVDRDLSGLTLILGKGAEITGRIVVEGEASTVDWQRISLSVVPTGNMTLMTFGGSGVRVSEDFTFEISNRPEGTYRLVAKLPAGDHWREVHRELLNGGSAGL